MAEAQAVPPVSELESETRLTQTKVLELLNQLPVQPMARFVGAIAAAATIGEEWLTVIYNDKQKSLLGAFLATRLLAMADMMMELGGGRSVAGDPKQDGK